MYLLRQAAALSMGKVRRWFLVAFRRKRVEEKLRRRRGACTRCGACCKLLFRCPAYDDSDGVPKCLIYNDRPGVCSLFPLDEKDILDRDIVMPDRKCGFYFDDKPAANGNGHPKEAMPLPLRWGPPKIGPNGRRRLLHGSLAALWAFVRVSDGKREGRRGAPDA